MLGEIIYEETGKTTGTRVLSVENGATKVEVSVQTEGKVRGVGYNGLLTYWAETRADGSIYGEGIGSMTTKDGDVIPLRGSGAGKAAADGSVTYRGAVFFHTSAEKYADLNTIAGVFEFDADADGNTAAKAWEWK